jgi:uncharacterized membrane protein
MPVERLLSINLTTSLYMTGLIWFVQIVHYPLFAQIPIESFKEYEQRHQTLTSFVVAPVMLAELAASIAILAAAPTNRLFWITSALTALVWLSTLLIQMPLHAQLSQTHSLEAIHKLVNTNWLRTVAWSLRSLLLLYSLTRPSP